MTMLAIRAAYESVVGLLRVKAVYMSKCYLALSN